LGEDLELLGLVPADDLDPDVVNRGPHDVTHRLESGLGDEEVLVDGEI
jgi:hypothetical protein